MPLCAASGGMGGLAFNPRSHRFLLLGSCWCQPEPLRSGAALPNGDPTTAADQRAPGWCSRKQAGAGGHRGWLRRGAVRRRVGWVSRPAGALPFGPLSSGQPMGGTPRVDRSSSRWPDPPLTAAAAAACRAGRHVRPPRVHHQRGARGGPLQFRPHQPLQAPLHSRQHRHPHRAAADGWGLPAVQAAGALCIAPLSPAPGRRPRLTSRAAPVYPPAPQPTWWSGLASTAAR